MSIWKRYSQIPLVYRIVAAFAAGIGCGIVLWYLSSSGKAEWFPMVIKVLNPFGTVLILMLKMIVMPVIFFSLVVGAASLPLSRFGKMGVGVLAWYFLTSLFAGIFGTVLAKAFNPSMANAAEMGGALLGQVEELKMGGASAGTGVMQIINSFFVNPFQALAQGQFLGVIVFAILFGLAARAVLDHGEDAGTSATVQRILEIFDALLKISFRIVEWILHYFPIGVFALTTVNFALYGIGLFGPYLEIAGCVILGVLLMLFLIYPLAAFLILRENPYKLLLRLKEPVITAFATRSSAAALPVSLATAKELGVRNELASFALPLGATVNMDGVCIHLPVFAILAANIFGIELGFPQLALLVMSVVLASIGTGGIPGGSIFLLFMVLENMGLSPDQVALIVALAIGVNPLMDMFETACNVAGDNFGCYIVARKMKMIDEPPDRNG